VIFLGCLDRYEDFFIRNNDILVHLASYSVVEHFRRIKQKGRSAVAVLGSIFTTSSARERI